MRENRGEARRFGVVDTISRKAEEMAEKRNGDCDVPKRAILLQLLKLLKGSVHEHEIGAGDVDAGRKEIVWVRVLKPAVAQAEEHVGKYPKETVEQMRRRQTGNAMPVVVPAGRVGTILEGYHLQVRDPLKIEKNLVDKAHCKAFEGFGNGTLCAVLAVKKQGDNGELQLSLAVEQLAPVRVALLSRTSEDDRAYQGITTDRH